MVKLMLAVLLMLGSAGCATLGPYREFAPYTSQLQVGMTQEQVRRVLGEPRKAGYFPCKLLGGEPTWRWDYRKVRSLWRGIHLAVFFSSPDGTVISWEEWPEAASF